MLCIFFFLSILIWQWGKWEGGVGYSITYHSLFDCYRIPTEEQLKEVAQHSGVLEIDVDIIKSDFRSKYAC